MSKIRKCEKCANKFVEESTSIKKSCNNDCLCECHSTKNNIDDY